MTVKCEDCHKTIPKERLEILPDTRWCVGCSGKHPQLTYDAELVCAKASPSGQNGWSPSS